MRRCLVALSWCSITLGSLGQNPQNPKVPQASGAEPASTSFSGEAFVVEQAETSYRYEADGTGEKDVHEKLELKSEAGARQFSVLSLAYASATESPQIESVVVTHPDGSKTETPAADAMTMPAPVTQAAPLYSDLKQLQIPVRGLRAGDVLDYRVRIQRKNPEAPAQFWDEYFFEPNAVTLSETLSLDVPAGKYVQVWSPDRKPKIAEKDGRRVYTWAGSQLKPTSSQPKKEAFAPPTEIKPDVAWTTFHSWAEVGEWYRTLAAERAQPTDALRAQADEITRSAGSPLEQVGALYNFVSTHVRYVGIDFGIGRYQPHMATEILANQYGDCKDKDTLLEALLRAKGFTTAPALIGVNLAMVAELPSPALFNHVITTVSMPDGRVWMDSTPGVAPIQFLLSPLRDKQALVVPSSGNSDLETTPARPPFLFADSFEAAAALDGNGNLSGKVKISYRSDTEILMRLASQNLAPAQWDQGTQAMANAMGFSGTTSNSSFSRAEDTSQPLEVTYDYAKKPYGDWESLRIVALFPVLPSLPGPPEKLPESEIDLGALRTDSAHSTIQLPAGYSAELPDSVHVKTAFATCDITYKFENGSFTAERKLVILESRLPAASWEQYKKFTKDIGLGELEWVQLRAPAHAGNGAIGSALPGGTTSGAADLIRQALTLETSTDWDGAVAKLDEAKKLNPEQPFLWSNYGYIAMRQNHTDDAKEDFRHELAQHPDESYVVNLYAGMLIGQGGFDEAQTVLKAYFDRDATDQRVDLTLASIQAKNSAPDAMATLRRASDALPDNPLVQAELANYLNANHQESDAAALMEKLLATKIDDPNVLNDAAYALAQANADLPLAEKQSRKSLEMLADESGDAEVSEANPATFQHSYLAAASWDTLGFIFLKEGKLDEARDYLEAAWRNQPRMEDSLHYGEFEEAIGDSKAAMRIYALAPPSSSNLGSAAAGAYDEIKRRMERLETEGVPLPKMDRNSALQQERTFKLKLAAMNAYWTGTYRLQLDGSGIDGAMQVSGMARKGVVEAIKQLSLPHLAPNDYAGFIVRDAVISCSAGKTECELVLMPMGGMEAEGVAP